MAAMTYIDFDLLVERFEQGYRARVLNSPAGQATAVLPSPLAQLDLERFLTRVGRPYRGLVPGANHGPDAEIDAMGAVVTFGTRLFEFLFAGEVGTSLRRSLDEAERQGAGLRIRLRMADAPELADLPWEFLYDATVGDFLALSARTPLVRYLDLPRRIQPVAVRPPLRILVAIASPANAIPLDADAEWRILQQALSGLTQDGRIVLERLEEATIPALQRKLRQGAYHVFHFIGHGTFDAQSQRGMLLMEDADGQGMPFSAERLGALLHDEADTLRLVVLNACHGARTSQDYPFAGLAQGVVRKGIPAVIAMQFAITDDAAIIFAQAYYQAIADGYPVDAAFGEARKAVYLDDNEVEWATPVLFMRAPDGGLWDMAGDENEEEMPMNGKEEGAWWDAISAQAGGDLIIGYAGAGSSGVAIGKDITQRVYGVLGEPTRDDRQIIEQRLARAMTGLQDLREQLDAATATMAEFQLGLLQGELTKTAEDEMPSASTITRVGDWLLDNVPAMGEILATVFATPAVGRVVGKAGEAAVEWVRKRFG
jgi:hypothetical protein